MRSRTRWRSRLFTRLRVTAGPTDRATTKPIRRSCVAVDPGQVDHQEWPAGATATPHRRREPRGVSEALASGEHTEPSDPPAQAARRVRPLRRREARMLRPARVRIRSRKPCVL